MNKAIGAHCQSSYQVTAVIKPIELQTEKKSESVTVGMPWTKEGENKIQGKWWKRIWTLCYRSSCVGISSAAALNVYVCIKTTYSTRNFHLQPRVTMETTTATQQRTRLKIWQRFFFFKYYTSLLCVVSPCVTVSVRANTTQCESCAGWNWRGGKETEGEGCVEKREIRDGRGWGGSVDGVYF